MLNLPSECGMILVVVLWVMLLLSVLAGHFAYSMRMEMRLAANGLARAQARALAEAGVAYAMMHIQADARQVSGGDRWPVDGRVREWQFGQGKLRIAVVDAGGLVDLNRADRNLLKGLLRAAGRAEGGRLEALVDAIEDWRDPDDGHRASGAEAADYQAAGWPVGPKNAPFESVEELQQVLGMSKEIYQRVAPGLTVYSRHPGVDPRFAPAAVLAALPGIDQQAVEGYLQSRARNADQGLPPPPPPATSGSYLSHGGGEAYHVSVEAQLDTGIVTSIQAVVSPPLGPGQAYKVLAWHEGR